MAKKLTKDFLKDLQRKSILIRKDILTISHKAYVGHIGSALSIADILCVLYFALLRFPHNSPTHEMRDRFILSKGHAAAALYSCLYRKRFLTKKELYSFCQDGGLLGVHPEQNFKKGIELSTGSLGHGLSVACGIALGLLKTYKENAPKVFVLISDAELNEGSTWEAIMFASHHKLKNLCLVIDDNKIQAFGKTHDVIALQPLLEKFMAFGWMGTVLDGHNLSELYEAFYNRPALTDKPTVIIANTVIGKGVTFMENTIDSHYLPIDKKLYRQALLSLSKN